LPAVAGRGAERRAEVERALVKRPYLKAVVTDVHFWVPVVVLVIGLALLLVLQ
jgi:hypothetical protein